MLSLDIHTPLPPNTPSSPGMKSSPTAHSKRKSDDKRMSISLRSRMMNGVPVGQTGVPITLSSSAYDRGEKDIDTSMDSSSANDNDESMTISGHNPLELTKLLGDDVPTTVTGSNESIPEAKICNELGIKMVDQLGDKINSSSWLISRNQGEEIKVKADPNQ